MADDEKKKGEDESEEKKSGGGTMKMVLMIGLPLMLFQAGIAYFLISKIAQPQQAVADVVEEEEDPEEPGKLYMVPDVIVNPAGTQGIRFLNITMALEFTKPEVEQELMEKEVQLRDILIGILVSKTLEDIDGADEKDMLKEEIRDKVNEMLTKGKIRRVYFSNFVMQ